MITVLNNGLLVLDKPNNAVWFLKLNMSAAFDIVNHQIILAQVGKYIWDNRYGVKMVPVLPVQSKGLRCNRW